ncbi:MAG: DinB family protein [Betaproteobacteria bacterium]|nr:DinB family protein [Betaproteobacteria bacterium]
MSLCNHIVLMASYNEWMNARLYEAAEKLSPQELAAYRKAFFGSLLGTLNHIVVGDTIWLKRFATHPAGHIALDPVRQLAMPSSLDQVLFADFAALSGHRKLLDNTVNEWAASLTEDDMGHVLKYTNSKGVVGHRKFSSLVLHFFNHQTHHRGQATTLLYQAGRDVGVTDLLALIPNEPEA